MSSPKNLVAEIVRTVERLSADTATVDGARVEISSQAVALLESNYAVLGSLADALDALHKDLAALQDV